jgi:hypothetical protein
MTGCECFFVVLTLIVATTSTGNWLQQHQQQQLLYIVDLSWFFLKGAFWAVFEKSIEKVSCNFHYSLFLLTIHLLGIAKKLLGFHRKCFKL